MAEESPREPVDQGPAAQAVAEAVASTGHPPEPESAWARRVRIWRPWVERVLLVGGIALMVWVVMRFPMSQILDACEKLGWAIILTPMFCMGWFAAGSTSLYVLLEGVMPWRSLMWNRVVGEGYNSLIPAGGLGGEPFKLRQIQRWVETDRALVALLYDRLLENAVALCFSGTVCIVGTFMYALTPAMRTTFLVYGLIANGIVVAIAIFLLSRLPTRIGGRAAKLLGAKHIAGWRPGNKILVKAIFWNIIARAIGQLETTLLYYLLGLPLTLGMVVFTAGAISAAGFIGGAVPQGVGVTDAAALKIFEILKLPGPSAIAFALARRGRMLVCSTFGVLLHLTFGRRFNAAEERRLAARKAAAELLAATASPDDLRREFPSARVHR